MRFPTRRKVSEVIPPAQQRWLEEFAVAIPRSIVEFPERSGFGKDVRAVGSEVLPLIREVEDLTGRGYHWFLSNDDRDMVVAVTNAVVLINPGRLAKADVHLQLFLLLHEAGHQIQNSHAGGKAAELAADEFAAEMMLRRGFKGHEIVWIALTSFKSNDAGSEMHPSGEERVKNLRKFTGS